MHVFQRCRRRRRSMTRARLVLLFKHRNERVHTVVLDVSLAAGTPANPLVERSQSDVDRAVFQIFVTNKSRPADSRSAPDHGEPLRPEVVKKRMLTCKRACALSAAHGCLQLRIAVSAGRTGRPAPAGGHSLRDCGRVMHRLQQVSHCHLLHAKSAPESQRPLGEWTDETRSNRIRSVDVSLNSA